MALAIGTSHDLPMLYKWRGRWWW